MRRRPDAAMIFAAGLGTRMAPLTLSRPKALVEVAGRPLVDHAIALAREAGIGRIVVNVHHFADMMAAHLRNRGVLISDERGRLLETGGGLKKARPLLDAEAVVTINVDAILSGPNAIDALASAWDPSRMDGLLLLVAPPDRLAHAGGGDFAASGDPGPIRRGGPLTYAGLAILSLSDAADWPDGAFSLNVVFDRMIASGRLFGLRHRGSWVDVGHPDGIAAAERLLKDDEDVRG
ncbi:MAG: nucleotidyltransferase family protein [Alphaproteobacteria bacterium]|nr:MAG: nucleotidyltransferase family protein [Alphaproteobacteria bacterium]